jgi:prolyl oligopeptidase
MIAGHMGMLQLTVVGVFLGGMMCAHAVFGADASPGAAPPPVAVIRPVVNDYHGTKVDDPYRYFENFTDPAVQAWVKAQGEFADHALRAIPGRDALLARIRELDEGAPYRIRVIRRWPNRDLHYLKRLASENLDKLYFRDAKSGQERLLVDPERLATKDGKFFSISFVVPSPDAKYVAYGLAASGSEQTVLRVLDAVAMKDLPDTIDRMEADYTEPCWLPDASGFVYSRRQKLADGAPATEGYKKTRAYVHRLGRDVDKDPLAFAIDSPGAVPMTETDFPSLVLTTGSRYAVGKIKHGDTPELTLYAAPLDSLGKPEVFWKKVCDAKDEVKEFAVHGDDVYLMSSAGSPRYRVIRTPLASPDFARAATVVPEGEAVIEGVSIAKDALYVSLLDGGLSVPGRVAFDDGATLRRIALPEGMSAGYAFGAEPDVDGTFVGTASWTRAGRYYAYDPKADKLIDTGLAPQGKFDNPEGYVSREVRVTRHDGVQVPLSIIHKAGLKLDGSNPTLVTGYGSYGMTMYVYYDPKNLAWLERGGVLAVAHVRGGGEFGRQWHLAGRMATKPNTWTDFIACCEYLVREGYTSPPKLTGQGVSAGGILIGRAITDRPDLLAAAIVGVGCTDLLRAETTTNGVPNIQEFGTVKTKEGFDALLAMSPYHHVAPGTKYPAVLLTHGINDPRVEPWMSAKLTARLQAASTSGKPVLFRVEHQAGHGIGSTKTQRQEQRADEWAFLLWQTGAAGFVPTR